VISLELEVQITIRRTGVYVAIEDHKQHKMELYFYKPARDVEICCADAARLIQNSKAPVTRA
jgi:hypothetical protein